MAQCRLSAVVSRTATAPASGSSSSGWDRPRSLRAARLTGAAGRTVALPLRASRRSQSRSQRPSSGCRGGRASAVRMRQSGPVGRSVSLFMVNARWCAPPRHRHDCDRHWQKRSRRSVLVLGRSMTREDGDSDRCRLDRERPRPPPGYAVRKLRFVKMSTSIERRRWSTRAVTALVAMKRRETAERHRGRGLRSASGGCHWPGFSGRRR